MKKTKRLSWMSVVRGNPIPWLLQKANPCVRHRTLTELLDRPADDPEVRATVDAIWKYPPVKAMLDALETAEPFPPGTIWSGQLFKKNRGDLDILYRLGVPRGHPVIAGACDRWLDVEIPSGAICYAHETVAGLVRYAEPDDPRLAEKLRYVLDNEPFVDGDRPGALRYGARGSCCGSHSCHLAATKAMWAAVGIPPKKRTPEVEAFIRRGARYLARHKLTQRSNRPESPIAKQFLSLRLPVALGCDTDVLDLLDIATQAGLERDESIADALDLLLSKQNRKGRWTVEVPLRRARWRPWKGRLGWHIADVESAGAESKWLTLGALLVLKRCERLLSGAKRTDLAAEPDPDADRMYAPYPFAADPADERRVRDAWKTVGVEKILQRLAAFAGRRDLATGWHWGFVMGPDFCREWLAARPRRIPRKTMREAWPVVRVFFLTRRGQFTPEAVAKKLGVPLEDEHEKARLSKIFWRTLWRVRIAKWRDRWEEVAVTLRDPKELTRLLRVLDAALADLPRE